MASFDEIKGWLKEFNATGESEDYTISWDSETGKQHRIKNAAVHHDQLQTVEDAFKGKLAILNRALGSLGFANSLKSEKWGYIKDQGESNRGNAFENLLCEQYSGVILSNERKCGMPKN